ncbi:MAG: tRNA (adenosine(37)-N6)-dimethylallyltransferase MiaA [Marinilabiliales bacterium]|nr:MAG: tRNA (adenosine(37)-N6)-dimethylallyltransferase MiaA [Marinilabiliales bacterium]
MVRTLKDDEPLLITVLGPTASGKTAFAACLAHALDGEIISADSRQVYRGMDIGTGKDYSDYTVNGEAVPVHLIDIVDAGYKYSVYEYQRDFVKAWDDIISRGRQPLLCGGSGMYLEAVLGAYELINVPHDQSLRKELESKSDAGLREMLAARVKLHNVSDTSSRKRLIRALEIALYREKEGGAGFVFPRFEPVILGIAAERDERRRRITARLDARLNEGLVEEVRRLLDGGLSPDDLMFYGLEYKYVTMYVKGDIPFGEMRDLLNTAIHQFAKRQMTWFRKMERNGYKIHWIDAMMPMQEKLELAGEIIKRCRK